jgi:hypothetical protein
MSRRRELLAYGLMAGTQLLAAWAIYTHHPRREAPPPAAAHALLPAAAAQDGGQASRRSP